jgi:adenine-specific DNA-methyltransferase
MMLPRLFLARNLLRDDGVIFVHIDDNEVHNLCLLMNEIFGEENFVGQWNWFKSATPPNLSKKIKKNIEYILCYQRGNNNDYFKGVQKTSSSDDPMTKPQNTIKTLTFPPNSLLTKLKDGVYKAGIYGTKKFPNELCSDMIIENGSNQNEAVFKNKFVWLQSKLDEELLKKTRVSLSNTLVLSYKKAEYSEEVPPNLIDETVGVDTTENAGKYLTELFEGKEVFDYPKPISLLKYLINFLSDDSCFILDFFAGSGSTAQAVLELNVEDGGNRKFILVQLPEPCDEASEACKAGYKTIADISRERIRRVSEANFKSYKLSPSNFKVWRSEEITEENIEQQMEMFIDPVKPESQTENMLVELMLKAGYLLTDNVENKGDFYYINNELVIALTKMDLEIAEKIIALQPKKVIALDRLFAGNDELKTNTALQMRDAGVEFRVV